MKKIFVTGSSGFLGRHLLEEIKEHHVYAPTSKELDLTNYSNLEKLNKKFDEIYHLAAWTQAGDFCLKNPGLQWIINQQINTNILSWWLKKNKNAKLIFVGTSCCYDENGDFKEESYLDDKPHESLLTYAMTKKMLLQGAISLEKQFGMQWLCVTPSTLYGKNYHDDGRQAHFIFDLINKIYKGKKYNENVKLWGSGDQKREIIHVKDFIKNMIKLNENKKNELFNIGAGRSHSIKEFAQIISNIMNYDYSKIVYDKTKYTGALNKELDINKIQNFNKNYLSELIPVETGIREIINSMKKKNG